MDYGIEIVKDEIPAAQVEYRRSDYTIVYYSRLKETNMYPAAQQAIDDIVGIERKPVLLLVDHMTMEFSENSRILRAIDSYSNSEHWSMKEQLSGPDPDDVGLLRLVTAENVERIELKDALRYEYCDKSRRLVVRIGEVKARPLYVRASSCLVVGIEGGVIRELHFDDLRLA